MSILEDFRRDEPRVLDRLVDGELGQDERRELLAALDDEPGAWRRCALAFLESQTWRWQLLRLAKDPLAHTPGAHAVPLRSTARRARFWAGCLAIAASLLVSFGLGLRFQSAGRLLEADNRVPQSDQTTRAPVAEVQFAPQKGDETLVSNDLDQNDTITLALNDGENAEREIRVPVSEADAGQNWSESESAMPTELLQSLLQAGLEVRRRQQWMPIDLSDGRRLIVPIEEIEIHDPQSVELQ
jgi:hypothetical protein